MGFLLNGYKCSSAGVHFAGVCVPVAIRDRRGGGGRRYAQTMRPEGRRGSSLSVVRRFLGASPVKRPRPSEPSRRDKGLQPRISILGERRCRLRGRDDVAGDPSTGEFGPGDGARATGKEISTADKGGTPASTTPPGPHIDPRIEIVGWRPLSLRDGWRRLKTASPRLPRNWPPSVAPGI
jgi:hypothetical protein